MEVSKYTQSNKRIEAIDKAFRKIIRTDKTIRKDIKNIDIDRGVAIVTDGKRALKVIDYAPSNCSATLDGMTKREKAKIVYPDTSNFFLETTHSFAFDPEIALKDIKDIKEYDPEFNPTVLNLRFIDDRLIISIPLIEDIEPIKPTVKKPDGIQYEVNVNIKFLTEALLLFKQLKIDIVYLKCVIDKNKPFILEADNILYSIFPIRVREFKG